MQPVYEFGGQGPVLNLALANGFPPETYSPLMQPFTEQYHSISVLPRALWSEVTPPPTTLQDWREGLATDLLAGFREYAFENIVAMGHSFGGIASLLAVIEEPARFKALILLDPTILTDGLLYMFDAARENGMIDQMPLAARAIKRQRTFENRDAAFAYFKGRGVFADWSDDAVWRYIDTGMRPTENGITLRWLPEWEAYYFKTIYTGIWEDLPKLRGLIPTLILRGKNSDTYVEESAEKVKTILPDATHLEIPGHGHLFPHTAPETTREIVQGWLEKLDV